MLDQPDDPRELPPSVLDAYLRPDDVAAWARTIAPGSTSITPMAVIDPAQLSPAGRVDALVVIEQEIAWAQARQLRVLAAMVDDPCDGVPFPELDKQWIREDVRCALQKSAVDANDLLQLSTYLTHTLPSTLTALEQGRITLKHARVLVDATLVLDPTVARLVEADALPENEPVSVATFRRRVLRAVTAHDPEAAAARHEQKLRERRVEARPEPDGMGTLSAFLPATELQTVSTALDVIADSYGPDDPRSRDQRRADALVQLAIDAVNGRRDCPHCHPGGDTSTAGAVQPLVQVTVALSTLLGVDEQDAELEGYGSIPAALAVRIAGDESATWRRLVTDERGQLLDYGRHTYRPPADLVRFVKARDRTCRFPTCNRKVCGCETDHIIAWADGGGTSAANTHSLCCRHHHGKHEGGWKVERLPDGTTKWTSPTGHVYLKPPATYPIDHTRKRQPDHKPTPKPRPSIEPNAPAPF